VFDFFTYSPSPTRAERTPLSVWADGQWWSLKAYHASRGLPRTWIQGAGAQDADVRPGDIVLIRHWDVKPDDAIANHIVMVESFDRIVGLERLRAIHMNDSQKGIGSRVDRHAHIGKGMLGVEPFRFIMNDPRLASLPKVLETPKGKVLSLFEKTTPKVPHKSPFGLALLKDVVVGDFVLEADVQSTVKAYPQQDLCLVFGYQDNGHFYYSHLGRKTDKANNQVYIVNGADRAMISLRTSGGTDLSDEWTHVKVVRKIADGTIEVYWDDMKTPVQIATNKTFLKGRVGVGSFDDLGQFDNVVVRGIQVTEK
jgi:hypothetical protein